MSFALNRQVGAGEFEQTLVMEAFNFLNGRSDVLCIYTWRYLEGDPYGLSARFTHSKSLPFFRKEIDEEGKVKWKRPAKKPWLLFGLETLRDAKDFVFVAEGEKDCCTVQSLGLVAVSPGGSNYPNSVDWTPLDGIKRVYVFQDNDKAGRKFAQSVVDNLAKLKSIPEVWIAELPDLPDGGDVTDWVASQLDESWNQLEPVPIQHADRIRNLLLEMLPEIVTLGKPSPPKPHKPKIVTLYPVDKESHRNYFQKIWRPELDRLASATKGNTNNTVRDVARRLGELIHYGHWDYSTALQAILDALPAGLPAKDYGRHRRTAESNLRYGMENEKIENLRPPTGLRTNGNGKNDKPKCNGKQPGENGQHTQVSKDTETLVVNSDIQTCVLANYAQEFVEGTPGKKGVMIKKAIPISDTGKRMNEITNNWPRAVGGILFYHNGEDIHFLDHADALFSFLHLKSKIRWLNGGKDSNDLTFVTKPEFYSHVTRHAQQYDGVERSPHFPEIEKLYYIWEAPKSYTPDGSYLKKLLQFFDNPATPLDAELIKVAFCTPAWGGPAGRRPAFVVTAPDRGCGKSVLCSAIAELYRGAFQVEDRDPEEKLKERLLTPAALDKRIILFDNVRKTLSAPTYEAMLTSREISGRRLYSGEATRPNYFTWILSANTPNFSRDFAERSFFIRLEHPTPKQHWDAAVMDFILQNRDFILADVLRELKQSHQCKQQVSDRWQSWVDEVLRRISPLAVEIVLENQKHRDACDEDKDEATAIRDAVFSYKENTDESEAFVMNAQLLKIVNDALGVNWKAMTMGRKMKGHIEAGRLDAKPHRVGAGRGYIFKL